MAVPKKKRSLSKRKYHNSVQYKRLNFFFYKKCLNCHIYVKSHTYCVNCIDNI